jgi:hypothetical protein
MDHASGTIAPPDAEVVQAGDAARQRAQRRGLVQGSVRPVRVAEVVVFAQDGHQVALVPDQGPVKQLTPAAANPVQFAVCGPVRGVWLWLRDQGLRWPLQGACRRGQDAEITWVAPTCHAVHTTLTNPAYAGACAYGRTRPERYLDSRGVLRSRRREMPRDLPPGPRHADLRGRAR